MFNLSSKRHNRPEGMIQLHNLTDQKLCGVLINLNLPYTIMYILMYVINLYCIAVVSMLRTIV